MGYIHAIQTPDNTTHLIQPLLFATAGGSSTAVTAGIDNFELVPGAYANVKVGTVGANATLQVGSTTACDIYCNGAQINAGMLTEDTIYTFVYDGTKWNVVGDITGKNIMIGTTAEWIQHHSYVAPPGTVVIYTDHGTISVTANGSSVTRTVPGIKITDGSTPIIDLPFVGDDVIAAVRQEISDHINDNVRHITAEERTFWNNKINCDDVINSHNLIIYRN